MEPKHRESSTGQTRHHFFITAKGNEQLLSLRDEVSKIVAVVLIYLVCELLIWGLSQPFRAAHIRFPACVIGMVLVFVLMCILQWIRPSTTDVYARWIKSKVGVNFKLVM